MTNQYNSNAKAKVSNEDEAIKKMIRISLICIGFLLAELVGGIVANSLAILTDAAHLLSDLSGFIISIIAIWIGKKPANSKYTFGYYRAEVIGALISVVTIWILTGVLLKEAYDRLVNPSEINAPIMLLVSIIGLICNFMMLKVLHSSEGTCHHSHSHSPKNLLKPLSRHDENDDSDEEKLVLEDEDYTINSTKKKSKHKSSFHSENEEDQGHIHKNEHDHSHDHHDKIQE
jgi:zinc transporter 2